MGALLQPVGPLGAGTYWRRRLMVIAAVLVSLWLISRLGGQDGAASATDENQVSVTAPSASELEPGPDSALDPAATHPNAAAPASTQPSEVPLAPPTAGPAGGPAAEAAGLPPASSGATQGPQPCSTAELSLAVTASRTHYAEAAQPQLTVTIGASGAGPCTQELGPTVLAVVITSGQDRIWASQDCATASPDVRVLTPGSPVSLEMSWPRVRSEPGCQPDGTSARPGTYVATPVVGERAGQQVSFLLD